MVVIGIHCRFNFKFSIKAVLFDYVITEVVKQIEEYYNRV